MNGKTVCIPSVWLKKVKFTVNCDCSQIFPNSLPLFAVLSILVLALVAVQFAFAGDVITQDTKQLPLTARNFINQYFSKPHISHIKIESEILQTKKYEVLLTDRTEIDFDKKGNWLEVDCKKSAVPEALIPVPVKEYVKANFPREIITKIERGRTGVEIELGNDYSLKFNKKGKFVSMDD